MTVYTRNGRWHGRGGYPTLNGVPSVTGAMSQAGLLYDVEKSPSYAKVGGKTVKVPGSFHLVRPPFGKNKNHQVFSTVGSRYRVIQNGEVASALDVLTSDYKVAAVGEFNGGEDVFVELRLPDFTVGGQQNERHQTNILVVNRFGKGGVLLGMVSERLVCANMLPRLSKSMMKISHLNGAKLQLDFRAEIAHYMLKEQQNLTEELNLLFTKKINKEVVAEVIETAYPVPSLPQKVKMISEVPQYNGRNAVFDQVVSEGKDALEIHEGKVERVEKKRRDVSDLFVKYQDEHPYGENAYWLLQAITEETTHGDYTGSYDKGMRSLFFGSRGKVQSDALKVLVG